MDKITIAMPVYNVQEYIRQALLSVLEQTIDNIELLIIDDCGNDKSIEIAKDIISNYHGGKSVRIIKQDHNMGISVARNTAIHEAQGKYIYFIDSDDFITKDCIESMSKIMYTNDFDFVVGSFQNTNEEGQPLDKKNVLDGITIKDSEEIKEFIFKDSKKNYIASVWNKMYKLSFIKDNHLIFVPNTYYEDNMFSLESYMVAKSIACLSDITYYYRQRKGSIMHIGKNAFIVKEINDLSNVRITEKKYLMKFSYCEHFEDAILSLSVNCFYQAKAYILHNFNNLKIKTYIQDFLYYPISITSILKFKRNKLKHICLWMLGKSPYCIIKFIMKTGAHFQKLF